jgi:PKD domain
VTTSIHVPASRTFARLAAPMTMAIACLASGAAFGQGLGADNPYSPANGHPYRRGVVPTREAWQHMKEWATFQARPGGGHSSKTLRYGGGVDGIGVTSGQPEVYLVVWGSQWGTRSGNTFSGDPYNAVPYLVNMFSDLGTGGELWSGVMTQYCDGTVAAGATSCPSGASFIPYPSPTTTVFAGLWYDNAAPAPGTATYQQIGQEAVKAAAHFNNTTAASNRYAQYVILSPTGTHPDGFGTTGGFCAWHDWNGDLGVASSYGDIALTNMPYVKDLGASCGQNFVNAGSAGTLDGFSIVEGHEYSETITDQNPSGGWTASSGQENADECAWISSGQGASANVTMGGGRKYAMQSTWSNDTNECDLSHAIVDGGGGGGGGGGPTASFSYTASGTTVHFIDGSTCDTASCTYGWTFGDGSTSNSQSPTYTYSKPGSYSVTETVTDSNNASDSATKTVSVKKH